ncbi:hypothetical protein C0Q70_11367 [Pomacea canaliculata]|uniref:Uncharacterized protein n=1 Tax=Pomacea canaliculata TaxID=400727 RepID=A0A2T7P5R0_POMCA|nr:hypothetical protein C0Q70_11367 [Pomacea canaliculata]
MQPSESKHAVAPATAHKSFLPTTDAGTKSMVHEGCRLASLASLPPSCAASRLRLAAAGFYYDVNTIRNKNNQHELVCFACGFTCSQWDTVLDSQSRLDTFRTWPPSHFFSPQELVPLGFFYAGYADCIRCFYCGVGLKSWEPADDVTQEHIRWRPSCGFILATRGRRFVETVLTHMQIKNDETKDDDSEKSSGSGQGSRMTCSSRTERNSRGSSYISVDIVSSEPRDLTSEVMNQVQEMSLLPELVSRGFQDVKATGCQETHVSASVERIVEKLQVPDSRRTTDESTELQTDGATTTETEARLQQLRQENAKLKARRTCRTLHNFHSPEQLHKVSAENSRSDSSLIRHQKRSQQESMEVKIRDYNRCYSQKVP